MREVFGRNLRLLRHQRGLSQEALAHEAGVDRTYISALERGVYSATIDMVEKLAVVLNADAASLLQRPVPARRMR
jgi:transcriptional regulator with XRE-family HTH domain